MNSMAIDADTMCIARRFENMKPELFKFKWLNKKLMEKINHITVHKFDSTQEEQLKNLSKPLKTKVDAQWI